MFTPYNKAMTIAIRYLMFIRLFLLHRKKKFVINIPGLCLIHALVR
jgi:hypothetical protein